MVKRFVFHNGLSQLDSHMSKVFILLLHSIKDISSRKITDLKVKAKEIRLLKVQTDGIRQFAVLVHQTPRFQPLLWASVDPWYMACHLEMLWAAGNRNPKWYLRPISSVQFSHSVVSDSLRPHEPQHARPPCPSPTPGVHPNPCPSSWCP